MNALLILLLLISSCINASNKTCPLKEESSCMRPDSIEVYNATTAKNIDLEIQSALRNHQSCCVLPKDSNCFCYADNIVFDLEPYTKMGITEDLILARSKYGTPFKVYNGRLYRHKYCEFEDRCAGVEFFLLKLAHKLPNLDFVLRVRDWPEVHFLSGLSGPIFSYTKTKYFLDILYPTWSFWRPSKHKLTALHESFASWNEMRKRISRSTRKMTWDQKLPIGFFRGARYSVESDVLVLLSYRSPDLVDAAYTSYPYQKMEADMFGPPPKEDFSFEYHCNFKYLFNFRAIGASLRLRHLFLCKSLVFHMGDEWQEFFYGQLKPWLHYVPVNSNADQNELEQLIKFFRENDELAKTIAERGYEFIWRHLRMEDVKCYWENLLKKYAQLLKYKVKPNSDFYEITSNKMKMHNDVMKYKNRLHKQSKTEVDKITSMHNNTQLTILLKSQSKEMQLYNNAFQYQSEIKCRRNHHVLNRPNSSNFGSVRCSSSMYA